jgi:hypothetical protein
MNVNHEISKKRLEVKMITDKRNQDKHEKKTLEDSDRAIKNKELEHQKVIQDIKIQFKNFNNSQNEHLENQKRSNAKQITQMLNNFDRDKAQNKLTLSEHKKQRELIEQKAKGKLYRQEKDQSLGLDRTKFAIDRKKDDWNVQKTKVNDQRYALHLR